MTSFAISRPIKLIFPNICGFKKVANNLFVDEISKSDEIQQLYQSTLENVIDEFKLKNFEPKVIFCSQIENFNKFGLHKEAAHAFWPFAIVISPRGWQKHYLKHEFIHFIQVKKLGIIKFLSMPDWFIEGMAYALSDDPRGTLSEPFESYRLEFKNWLKSRKRDDIFDFDKHDPL